MNDTQLLRARWSVAEMASMQERYETASRAEIEELFPGRSWMAIQKCAGKLGLVRRKPKALAVYPILRELRAVRRQRRIKTEVLAERIGIGSSNLCQWETAHTVPRFRTFLDWVQALDLRIELVPQSQAKRQ